MKKRLKKKIKPKVEPKLNKNQQALKEAQNDMQAQIRRLLEVNGIKKWAHVARFFCGASSTSHHFAPLSCHKTTC